MANDLEELKGLTRNQRTKDKFDDPRHYEAFKPEPRAQTLRISRKNGIDDYPSWGHFLSAKCARTTETSFRIFFTFQNVRVTGEYLGPVMAAIGAKRCDQITEFDPDQHDPPARGEPLIRSIELINVALPEALAEEESKLKKA